MNVLIVEDQPAMRDLLATVASSALPGVRVHRASDLAMALGTAGATAMDLVLLDLGLPDSEGIDTVRRFRSAFPGVTILAVSVTDDGETIAGALEAGASGFIPKGLSPSAMVSVLRGH